MPAAVAIPAAIAGGSSLLSGFLGSRAAGKASDIQSQAAQKAATGYETAGQDALSAFREGSGQANKTLEDVFGQISEQLAPWLSAGEGAAGMLSDFMKSGEGEPFQFGADQFQTDPGYQFRLAEGQKALEASAAARGLLGTSGTLKGITQYGQGFASHEYQNAYERALGTFKTNQENRRANLSAVVDPSLRVLGEFTGAAENFGDRASQNQFNLGELTGKTGLTTAQLVQEALMGGANARAAGTVGSANAWSGALGGVGQAAGQVGNYYQDKKLLELFRNPALGNV